MVYSIFNIILFGCNSKSAMKSMMATSAVALAALAILAVCTWTDGRPAMATDSGWTSWIPTSQSEQDLSRSERSSAKKSRILLVPGITASQLSAVTKKARWYEFCPRDSPKVIWIGKLWCLSYLELKYNAATNTYYDSFGVTTTAPGFGDTSTVECLADSTILCWLSIFQYFKNFVDYFEEKGYKRKVDIRAAPYDWRYAADMSDRNGYFDKVKSLIEEMYNGEGITLVGHSMGGLMSLYFLNEKVTQAWKDKYIKAFVPVAVPFGGAIGMIYTWFTGKMAFDLPDDAESVLKELSRSLESSYWLLPRPDIFGNQVLLQTPTKSYTANDYEQLFNDVGESIAWKKYKPTLNINRDLSNPNVPVYCIYGIDQPTEEKIHINDKFEANSVRVDKGSGDGSVNLDSLRVCNRFTSNVCTRRGSDSSHVGIVKSTQTFQTIESITNGQYTCYK